jgi:trehalose 6-phosphate phosphatase
VDPLLERRAPDSPNRRGQTDQRRVGGTDLAVKRVRGDPRERGHADRRKGRRRRGAGLPRAEEEEERHDHDPAADPEQRAEEAGDEADEHEPHGPYRKRVDAIATLAGDPARAAILLDVDGALAPIVPRPEDARVPPETQDELRRLHRRYALVGCVTGRATTDARHVVGVPDLVYVGNHGLDLHADVDVWTERLGRFKSGIAWPDVEDKGLTVSLHYRNAPDQEAARTDLEDIASRAREAGFVARFGRKVLELLPPIEANKGTAIAGLLAEHGLQRALYAGDDTTDLDAFRALDALELGIRVAVASPEGPPELEEAADLVVESPEALLELLRRL